MLMMLWATEWVSKRYPGTVSSVLDPPPGRSRPSRTTHVEPGPGQVAGGDQPVVPGTDHHHVARAVTGPSIVGRPSGGSPGFRRRGWRAIGSSFRAEKFVGLHTTGDNRAEQRVTARWLSGRACPPSGMVWTLGRGDPGRDHRSGLRRTKGADVGKRVARVLMGVVVASAMLVTSPVRVEAQLSTQPFAAYGNAAAVALNALGARHDSRWRTPRWPTPAGVVNSTGLDGTVNNQFDQAGPAGAARGKNAYGRGSGVEVGLLTPTVPARRTSTRSGSTAVAEANAAPPSRLVTREIADRPARAADGVHRPRPGPGHLRPRSSARSAGPSPTASATSRTCRSSPAPAAASSAPAPPATRSPRPAPSPTWSPTVTAPTACVAESQAIVAPVSLAGTGITIDIAGPIGFRVTATGKPGDPRNGVVLHRHPGDHREPAGPAPHRPHQPRRTSWAARRLPIDLGVIARRPRRHPAPRPQRRSGSVPAVAADGTSASASVDTLRLPLLTLPGISALDLALGHFEGAVSVPAGGVRCTIPVSKVANPDPVAGRWRGRLHHQHPQRPGPVQRPVRL